MVGKGKARKLSLTEAGIRIARSAPNKEALIRNAAMAPVIHRQIVQYYGAKGLPNDALLRQYLVWDRPEGQRFNEETVGAFIERFRKALEFSGATASDIIGSASDEDDENEDEEEESSESSEAGGDWSIGGTSTASIASSSSAPAATKTPKKPMLGTAMRDLPITLPSLAVAVLRVPVPMTEDDFNALSMSLTAFKPSLTKKPEKQTDPPADDEAADE